jgi:hypothetical protein
VKVLVALQPTVKLDPDPSKIVGGDVAQRLADGIAGLGLIACVGALAYGAVMWTLSTRGNNVSFTSEGKTKVLVAAVASLLIAGAPDIINYCIELAQAI